MFKNATILTSDFVKNELGYTLPWSPQMIKVKCRNYYTETCSLLNTKHAGGITSAQIESMLNTDEKKYKFKYAMAKQLVYDCLGKNSMMRESNEEYDVQRDAMRIYKELGLWREVAPI